MFPPFALHLLEVGEETGKLDAMMLQIADNTKLKIQREYIARIRSEDEEQQGA